MVAVLVAVGVVWWLNEQKESKKRKEDALKKKKLEAVFEKLIVSA